MPNERRRIRGAAERDERKRALQDFTKALANDTRLSYAGRPHKRNRRPLRRRIRYELPNVLQYLLLRTHLPLKRRIQGVVCPR